MRVDPPTGTQCVAAGTSNSGAVSSGLLETSLT